MKIYTRIEMIWNGTTYAPVSSESFEYDGPVDLLCGATPGQQNIADQQTSAYQTMTNQAQQVFGNSSSVFNDLVKTFAPTVAAGPNQEGFSAAEKGNLQSQAITETGQAYRNAKQAVGEAQAAQGGGNVGDTSGGSTTATDLGVATSAAQQTSSELGQIDQADYATGRQNYETAAQGLASATGVYNPATSMDSAATGSGTAAANTQNQIAEADNSWVNAVTGALGSVAGATISGGMKNLGSGTGFFGGSGSGSST